MTTPILIPIAGGKGGVGKSFLTANLGIALAQLGYSTLAVDMDLGGANLHSYLGLPNDYPGVGDYLKNRELPLTDLIIPTSVPNLTFLPGDGRIPFMANITHAQKMHLLAQLNRLPAQYILLDLGAGSAFNTLDLFGISPKGIMVTTPELPAIMNMLVFLKSFIFRVIERASRKHFKIAELLSERYNHPFSEASGSMASLQTEIASLDPEMGRKVKVICERYCPRIIFNMGEHPEELEFLPKVERSLQQLSMHAEYFGFIFSDPVKSAHKATTSGFLSPNSASPTPNPERVSIFSVNVYSFNPILIIP